MRNKILAIAAIASAMAAPIAATAAQLLRRHVAELALHLGARHRRLGRLRDAEIDELHLAVVKHYDVAERDVVVDQLEPLARHAAQLVRGVEPLGGLYRALAGDRQARGLLRASAKESM